jgi:multiple sugar transport system permease protein
MKMKRSTKTNITAYLCIAPALLGLFALTIIPVFGVIVMSLTQWTGLQAPSFIGMDNYMNIFANDLFFKKSIVVTLYFAFGAVIGGMIYSFIIAVMLNHKIPARGFWRSLFFIPYIVPAVAANVVWSWLYDANFGVFNYILNLLGFDKSLWIQSEAMVVPSLILMTIWGSGSLIVIFLAGLQNVPKSYLEAVEIDGGNSWHKFRFITIPMMTPIIFFNFLMSIIGNLQVFVPAFSITHGGPNNASLFIVYLIYREGFMRNNMGYACALSLIFFVFIALLTAIIFKTSDKWLYYEGK